MKNKNIIVTLCGKQQFNNKENDQIELVTHGTCDVNDGEYKITYEESQITGMGNTLTTLFINNEKVTLQRTGDSVSHMIFEKGKNHLGYYETPFGAFTIGIFSKKFNVNLDGLEGEIDIGYSLVLDNKHTSSNDFLLKFREA